MYSLSEFISRGHRLGGAGCSRIVRSVAFSRSSLRRGGKAFTETAGNGSLVHKLIHLGLFAGALGKVIAYKTVFFKYFFNGLIKVIL